jgi:hypothetical protein
MADNLLLYGLRYTKSHFGTTVGIQRVRVASGYSPTVGGNNVNVNVGDVVKKVSDGTVALAAAGDTPYGVVERIHPYFDGTRMTIGKYLPFNTVYGTNLERQSFLSIIPAENAIFEARANDKTTATTQALYTDMIGENVDLINVGDTTRQTVNAQINIGTNATTNTLTWRIVDISPRIDIDYTGLYVPLLITPNIVQDAPWTPLGI